MRKKVNILVATLVLSVGLTACTSTTGGTASPAPSGSASASDQPSTDPEVPKVAQPLDASKYATNPCGLLPQDVMTSLQYTKPGVYLPQGTSEFDKAGPSCSWKGELGRGAQIILGTGNRDRGAGGLAGIYAAYHDGRIVRFLERAPDVEGYPAVYYDVQDARARGNCGMAVGIADDLSFDVTAQGYQGQDDSCAATSQMAAAVIKTLKGA